nr:MAG TPA: hypothetical protein [Caudoviricetes sp.]
MRQIYGEQQHLFPYFVMSQFFTFLYQSLYRALNAKIRHTDQFIWSKPRNFCDRLKG